MEKNNYKCKSLKTDKSKLKMEIYIHQNSEAIMSK